MTVRNCQLAPKRVVIITAPLWLQQETKRGPLRWVMQTQWFEACIEALPADRTVVINSVVYASKCCPKCDVSQVPAKAGTFKCLLFQFMGILWVAREASLMFGVCTMCGNLHHAQGPSPAKDGTLASWNPSIRQQCAASRSLYTFILSSPLTHHASFPRLSANMSIPPAPVVPQDYICSFRYGNELEPSQCPPKMVNLNTNASSHLLDPTFITRAALSGSECIDIDGELGMPLNMIHISGAFIGEDSGVSLTLLMQLLVSSVPLPTGIVTVC